MPSALSYLAFQQRGGIADLSSRAKFRLTGADRVRYLNGQVTANVTRLGPADALPACVTTAKGRLCGEIFISALPDALLIDTEPELRELLFQRLEKYIIADDAALEDVTDSLALFHLLPAVTEEPAAAPDCTPPSRRARRFGPTGCDLVVPAAEAPAYLAQNASAAAQDEPSSTPDPRRPLLSAGLLDLIRIENGVPAWGRDLGEETLPPEAGLDRTHIDYHKGCYIGQEVISRLKSVGHVNRELRRFVSADEVPGDSARPLAPGMTLFAAGEPNRAVGQLTSAAYSFALGKPIALGYLKRGAPTDGLFARRAEEDPSAAIPVRIQG